jgi:hypothetical protein
MKQDLGEEDAATTSTLVFRASDRNPNSLCLLIQIPSRYERP